MRARGRILLTITALAGGLVSPNGDPGALAHEGIRGPEDPPTRFERFLLSACDPCVTESHPVATLSIDAPRITGLPRSGGAQPDRSGEIRVEALHAYELGRPSRQSLALRVTLFVAMGAGSELYRVAVGLVDEEDATGLSTSISDIAQLTATKPPGVIAERSDASARGGSLRIGLLTLGSESVAYAQAGEPSMLALRAVWDVPTTIYLPPEQLPTLAKAIGQAAMKIRQLRGG